mgnify:CR=1 FL=1
MPQTRAMKTNSNSPFKDQASYIDLEFSLPPINSQENNY